MAPEVVSANTSIGNRGHGLPVDWWSVGVLAIELLTGNF
jgi:serine/threonine protein kinase